MYIYIYETWTSVSGYWIWNIYICIKQEYLYIYISCVFIYIYNLNFRILNLKYIYKTRIYISCLFIYTYICIVCIYLYIASISGYWTWKSIYWRGGRPPDWPWLNWRKAAIHYIHIKKIMILHFPTNWAELYIKNNAL